MSLYPELGEKVSFSSMIVESGNSRQLLIYWFQAYERANSDTFSQKLATLWNKVLGKGQDNAFVRISTGLNENKHATTPKKQYFAFIRSFYPVFLRYIEDGHQTNGTG